MKIARADELERFEDTQQTAGTEGLMAAVGHTGFFGL